MLKKPSREQWITVAWVGGFVACGFLVALIAAIVVVSQQLPELDEITHYQPRQPLEIVTREGIELAQFGPERRRFMPVGEFPDVLKDALIATEDADFRNHSGISVKGIVRAAFSNLFHRHRVLERYAGSLILLGIRLLDELRIHCLELVALTLNGGLEKRECIAHDSREECVVGRESMALQRVWLHSSGNRTAG